MLPRATTSEYGLRKGKDSITKVVRAASKPGAILTARLDAAQSIPLRDQEVFRIENKSNDRFLDQWVVEVRDMNELENLGT